MRKKTHYEHIAEERSAAERLLEKVKKNKSETVKITLRDNSNTTFFVKKDKLKARLKKLEQEGKVIKSLS